LESRKTGRQRRYKELATVRVGERMNYANDNNPPGIARYGGNYFLLLLALLVSCARGSLSGLQRGGKGGPMATDWSNHPAVIASDSLANAIEVAGVIKWFDVAKGYGFIVPDNGMPDVLVHVTCLRRAGYQTAYEGARVVCEVLPRPKGLEASRIISMDESTTIHPAQLKHGLQ
jgi:cold shock CspA family protein